MADLRKLKDEAAGLAARGKLEKSAEIYRKVLDRDAADVATRQRLAEVLRRAGRTAEAIEAYRAVAGRFAADGLLVKAIAISKTILELDPGHVATQSALADLYARRAVEPRRTTMTLPAVAAPAPEPRRATIVLPPVAAPAPFPAEPPPRAEREQTDFARIAFAAETAARAAGGDGVIEAEEILAEDVAGESGAPAGMPRVPIFSDLPRDAFAALAEGLVLRRVQGGEVVLREGETGTTFYAVASGKLTVSRRDERGDAVPLARLGEGDFFGEMALLSGAPRAATVVAEEPCELLEIRPEVLLAVAGRHPQLASALRRFYGQRLLANALAASPVFRPFPKEERRRVLERFVARRVSPGERILAEGAPPDGLYLVLEGAVDVSKRRGGGEVLVSQLREGDLFGEMSCLRNAPASATVVVRRGGTLLRLARKDFDALVAAHPLLRDALAEIAEERAGSLDAVLSGRAQWTEDGLVLF